MLKCIHTQSFIYDVGEIALQVLLFSRPIRSAFTSHTHTRTHKKLHENAAETCRAAVPV